MMSAKRSLQSLALVLVVFTIFTVSLTETIQISDGFASKSTKGWVYELNPGESQVLTWTLINGEEVPISIEFRGEEKGSEFFIYEKIVTMEAKSKQTFEFIVSIPKDHPNNVEYRPALYATEKAIRDPTGGAQVLINYEMVAHPVIKIGPNPIFTPEPAPIVVEEEPIEIEQERPTAKDFQIVVEETIEEKLKRIQESNQANEVKVDDTFEESFEEEAVPELQVDDNYIEEPIVEINAVDNMGEEKIECDFFAMILSWFGFGKC